jgi:hypothetical protein
MQLRTSKRLITTMNRRIKSKANHLEQIESVMDEVAAMELGHTPVHIIECAADSLGHFRK